MTNNHHFIKSCQCHHKDRKINFTTSELSHRCWCGLLTKKNRVKETDYYYDYPTIPVRLNGVFWKAPVVQLLQQEPSLNQYSQHDLLSNYFYLISNYIIGNEIGRGTTNKVRQGLRYIGHNQWVPVALKWVFRGCSQRKRLPIFKQDGSIHMVSAWDKIQAELTLHSHLENMYIGSLIEVVWCNTGDLWLIVMELYSYRPLIYDSFNRLYRYPSSQSCLTTETQLPFYTLSEVGARHIIRQIFEGVQYLHNTFGIIHKDLKPENIMLTLPLPINWLQPINSPSKHAETLHHLQSNTYLTDKTLEFDQMSECSEHFLWDNEEIHEVEENDNNTELLFHRQYQEYFITNNSTQLKYCLCCSLSHITQMNNQSGYQHINHKVNDVIDPLDTNKKVQIYHKTNHYCYCCKKQLKVDNVTNKSDEGPCIKLIDFNSAIQTLPPHFYIFDAEGTRHFTPPECFSLKESSSEIIPKLGMPRDVWSIGCILYCFLCGSLPFDSDTPLGLILEISQKSVTYPSWMSNSVVDLLQKLLEKDPQKRVTIQDALKHSWFYINS